MSDSSKFSNYQEKKQFFANILSIYGRKTVLEALQSDLSIYRLHLASSNKPAPILEQITKLACEKHIEIVYHDKKALSRISKNSKQDQGVAADIQCPTHLLFDAWHEQHLMQREQVTEPLRLLALDGIHNPQNLGMIIRSATASGLDGILLSPQGTAKISPLVIKASAGTLFKAPLIYCDSIAKAMQQLVQADIELLFLDANAQNSAIDYQPQARCCYVLGNESSGISRPLYTLEHSKIALPMSNQVESLNVAVSAALICYLHHFQQ